MPEVKTEGQHKGEFLLSEGKGTLSRDVGTLDSGAAEDGTILAVSGTKLVPATGASEEVLAGVCLGGPYDAASEDVTGVPYIARVAEVKGALLKYPEDTAESEAEMIAALAAKDIIVREPFANFAPAPIPTESEVPSEVPSESE